MRMPLWTGVISRLSAGRTSSTARRLPGLEVCLGDLDAAEVRQAVAPEGWIPLSPGRVPGRNRLTGGPVMRLTAQRARDPVIDPDGQIRRRARRCPMPGR